jgi:CheY-like chemotaxis protein/signal transduction histidine kinase/HAMP domain-containing protein
MVYAKEFLSDIRNSCYDDFSREKQNEYAVAKGKYTFAIATFKASASQDLLDYFETHFERTQAVVRMNSESDSLRGSKLSSSEFVQSHVADLTTAIHNLKKVADFTLERTKKVLDKTSDQIAESLLKKIVLAAALFLIIITVAGFMIRGIVTSVMEVKDATERIIRGDIDFELNVSSKDEMGQLAESFNKMISLFQDYILLAKSIGKGEYETEIVLRSQNDLLGKALINMRDNIQRLSKEKETRTWLLTGNNEVNDTLREEKDVRNLAQDVINHITTYLQAQVAAIYIYENGQLTRVGSYALDTTHGGESFPVGQSLVGQAVLEKRYILFDQVPTDYIKISSALGSAPPTNILVFPFFYLGKVKGVIEIGTTKKFTPLDIEFLDLVGDSIAIALTSSQSRSKLRDLLEEMQRQAEELESQQEELRQFNDELLDKLKSIEQSEAILKVQQEELQQSNVELEEAANLLENEKQSLESAKALIEARAQNFESVSKYKSEFLANMSHELRTPLNSILILTQLLIENKNGGLNEKELKYAHVIHNSGNELLTLINDILDLSKVEAGKMEAYIDDLSVSDIYKHMSMMFSQVAKNKSIDFKINSDTVRNLIISTDRQRLEQILRNLLSNAFKFTPSKGSVTLEIYKPGAEKDSLKRLKFVDELIAFSVTDTGIGIQRDKQEVIFEAFRQVDSTDKRKYGGTGLGLSICRELTELLGGEIVLKSEEEKGSTFTLFIPTQFREKKSRDPLPLEAIDAKTPERLDLEIEESAEDDRASVHESSRTILIMEDDKEFAHVILDFVRERNYKGIIAYQGNTGLSYARFYKPDAILLDMKLPIMDGEEVIRQLKNDPDLRHIPVQIISGYSRKKEAMKLGAFDFLKKPVSREDLSKVFERLEDFANRTHKKLLVVENDREENKAMCELIGNGDVECFSAFSGGEAFEKLRQNSFDCIVVDIELSDVSGVEFLEKVKSSDELKKIPVIVYSTRDLTAEQQKKLGTLSNTVVLKTAYSHERLLDETTLFLHRVESKLPKEKQNIIRKLHRADEVLKERIVLIVDDDMRNIYSLTNVLEEEGMHCITAENGKEALSVLNRNEGIDIILMDVMMPEMNGYEATQEIRKTEKFNKLPIIALTAKAMKGDREKCLAAGMSDYITKPIDVNQLISLMRVWLYRK